MPTIIFNKQLLLESFQAQYGSILFILPPWVLRALDPFQKLRYKKFNNLPPSFVNEFRRNAGRIGKGN